MRSRVKTISDTTQWNTIDFATPLSARRAVCLNLACLVLASTYFAGCAATTNEPATINKPVTSAPSEDEWANQWRAMIPERIKNHPSLKYVPDDPALPRVLLIGDSISMGYTVPVRKLLKGQANIHRIPANGQTTTHTLANLDKWLGPKSWDVIHFNCGLHDLTVSSEVELSQYEKNIEQLVQRLKATGAKLIWASTTPVPEGAKNQILGRDVRYNQVAERVMEHHGIPINDLYNFALPRLKEIQKPANIHFTQHGSRVLASEVAKHIRAALATPSAKPSTVKKHASSTKSVGEYRLG